MRLTNRVAAAVTAAAIMSVFAAAGAAQDILERPVPPSFVTDEAAVVNPDYGEKIAAILTELEEKTGTQFLVFIVGSIGGGDALETAVTLSNKWGLGQAGADNGILMLIAVQDRSFAISVGDGLEKTLPATFVDDVAARHFGPNFRRGDFGKGIYDAVVAIGKKLEAKYGVTLSSIPRPAAAAPAEDPKQPATEAPPAPVPGAESRQSQARRNPPAPPAQTSAPARHGTPSSFPHYAMSRRSTSRGIVGMIGAAIAALVGMVGVGALPLIILVVIVLAIRWGAREGGVNRQTQSPADDDSGFWGGRRRDNGWAGGFASGVFASGMRRRDDNDFGHSHISSSTSSSHSSSSSGSSGRSSGFGHFGGGGGGHSGGSSSSSSGGHFSGGGGGHSSGGSSGKW